jgi:hypothetical protein
MLTGGKLPFIDAVEMITRRIDLGILLDRQKGMRFRRSVDIDPIALDLVKTLLDPFPSSRKRPRDILKHEWITGVKKRSCTEWFCSWWS